MKKKKKILIFIISYKASYRILDVYNQIPFKKLKKVNIKQATNHPNWKMGRKISIDSATMINKVFEIIEANRIFGISYNKLAIIIHPKSYVHAIIKLKNGLTKIGYCAALKKYSFFPLFWLCSGLCSRDFLNILKHF